MEFKQLRHFIAIVDRGSFSKAAIAIPISQPALTRSLQNLETSLGTQLLERSTRGLILTPAGEQLYQRAKLILKEISKAKNEINHGQSNRPQLNLGIAPLFASAIIPQAVLEFSTNQPDYLLNVTRGLFPSLIKQLNEGTLDGIFTNHPFVDLTDDLVIEPLFDISICYICSPVHPLAKKKNINFEELEKFPWAVVDEDNSNEIYRYIFANEAVVRDPIIIKTNSLTFLKSLVENPPFITLLPRHMVERDILRDNLTVLKVKGAELYRKGGLIYRKNSSKSEPRTALFNAIRKACKAAKA